MKQSLSGSWASRAPQPRHLLAILESERLTHFTRFERRCEEPVSATGAQL